MNYLNSLFIYLLGGLLLLSPIRLFAQKDLQAIEITGKGNNFTSLVFDYRRSSIRNQLCLPPNILCLPQGTKIRAITLPYRINQNGSTITESQGNMRVALGETSEIPEYKHPYSYIEEGLTTYYEGSDQLEFDTEGKIKYVTYNFDSPYEYSGNYLMVDLLTTTPNPLDDNYIRTTFHESESIINMRGENNKSPYLNSWKPDLILGVELPANQAVPFIPLTYRDLIFEHASVSNPSESISVPIVNLGDRAFDVTTLSGSNSFTLTNSKTVGANLSETINIQFTPQTTGTYEETKFLKTTAGNFEMKLSGTTYRQAPYTRVIKVSSDNPVRMQLFAEKDQITELTVTGRVDGSDIYFLLNEMSNLTKLDMSAAVSSDKSFNMRDESGRKFEQLALPAGIKEIIIPQNANLSRLILPLGFEGIGGEHVNGKLSPLPQNLTSLIVFGNKPISRMINGDFDEILKYIETVYVPENAIQEWKNSYYWRNKNILPITDAILQPDFGGNVVIHDDRVFTLDAYPNGEVTVSIKPDAEQVTASASLTNQAPTQIKELSLSYRLESRSSQSNEAPSDGLFSEKGAYSAFINENDQASLQNLSYNLQLKPREWHFIAFPFDVDKNAFVSAAENGSREYVIRSYDGQARANNGMDWSGDGNWKDADGTLQSGHGYILQTESPEQSNNGKYYYNLSLETNAAQVILNTQAVSIPLTEYYSAQDDNKNWNLIGNPYPAFYNIRNINFGEASIIIIWNGQGYTPLSIYDDSYSLRPLEAFFVQKPDNQPSITFNPEGRSTSAMATDFYTLRSASYLDRKLLNLSLSGETYTDKARIVINPSAKMDYDMNNDAIKWMSPNKELPQFYTLSNDGKRYAINERPVGTGCIPVGFYVGQTGSYTFKISPEDDWQQIYLIDKYENKQVDLCLTAYSFHTNEGTFDDRFEIHIKGQPTSNLSVDMSSYRVWAEGHTLNILTKVNAYVTIYTATGIQKYNGRIEAGSIYVQLEPGFYLVQINESTYKVIIH